MLVLIDAGHLLAAVGRALGVGAPRVAGRFDTSRLVDAVLSVLPPDGKPTVRWYDGVLPGAAKRVAPELVAREDVTVVELPVQGGRQRHVEGSVLRDVLAPSAAVPTHLVGDPRRHVLALDLAAEQGRPLTLIGVSDGERTPAPRLWLRRPDLWPALRPEERRTRPSPPRPGPAYRRPEVSISPLQRLPGVHRPGVSRS